MKYEAEGGKAEEERPSGRSSRVKGGISRGKQVISGEVEVGFEGVDVGFEGVAAEGGDAAYCASLFAGEAFLNVDVSGVGKFAELYAEVAGGRFGGLPKVYEVGFFDIHENRHYG